MLRTIALVCLVATSAAAQPIEPGAPVFFTDEPRGLFVGEHWRFQNRPPFSGLLLRTLADVVSIPAGVLAWDWKDASSASLVVAATVVLAFPSEPSFDVRLSNEMHLALGTDRRVIWTPTGEMLIWLGIWGGLAAAFLYGAAWGDSEWLETALLSLEAFAVTQLYVGLFQILAGREGPNEGSREGIFRGFDGFTRYFPPGTPSAQVSTMVAIFSVVMHYWDNPVVWIVLTTVGVVACVTQVADGVHFPSDVIRGAGLGFVVGRWLVRHRSSRYRYGEGGFPERINLTPMVMAGGGAGVGVQLAF